METASVAVDNDSNNLDALLAGMAVIGAAQV
jgi:hypothetical protein